MGTFVPGSRKEMEALLQEAGYQSFDELFADVPESVKLKGALDFEGGVSEMEALGRMEELAGKNHVYKTILRGAGAYDHYIPSIVHRVTSKETFLTAYTPYQAEISQGVLQSIFEYQSMICDLTGMDVSNASVYDGATAAAEGAALCIDRKRETVLISATLNPEVKKVIATYAYGRDIEVLEVPEKDGLTDLEALRAMADENTACFILAQPNYYGLLEDAETALAITHEKGAKFIMSCNPISLGLLKTPGEIGADLCVGEGQPLGLPLSFGGPYLGFMAASKDLMRKLPGRIVGETVDQNGERAFVLTLQAREQHIKREKASSNICSNEALCALTAAVYLAAVGPKGLREVALACTSKAHYLKDVLEKAGLRAAYQAPFFHEFVTVGEKSEEIVKALAKKDILAGLPLGEGRILWCATEKVSKEVMDEAAAVVKEVLS